MALAAQRKRAQDEERELERIAQIRRREGRRRADHSTPKTDPLVVRTQQLAAILAGAKEDHEKKYPQHEPAYGKVAEFIAFTEWLSEESDVDAVQIRAVMRQRWATIELKTAEKILMALDLEYLLSNGTIDVIPNPRWSKERWQMYMSERGCSEEL